MDDFSGRFIRKLYVNIDGASKGNPGPASIAVVVRDGYGRTLEEFCESVGKTTNNHAEYLAAIKALEISAKYCRNIVYIFTDSQLLVNHVNGRYRVRKRKMLEAILKIKSMESLFRTVRFFHIERENNRRADELASKVFSERAHSREQEGRDQNGFQYRPRLGFRGQ
jgi:ribonuclease HI